jgi:hypothetical protein
MIHPKYHRSVQQLIFDKVFDKRFDTEESEPIFDRYYAYAEVLRRIPPEDYEKLKSILADCFVLIPCGFVNIQLLDPNRSLFNTVGSRSMTKSSFILYLSPDLEQEAPQVMIANIAHALAGIIIDEDSSSAVAQAEAIYKRTSEWGFKKEAESLLEVSSWLPEPKAEILAVIRG